MEEIYKTIKHFGKVKIDEPLQKHTTFKIGGNAKIFITVEKVDAVIELLQYLDEKGVAYMIFGGGSNMLVADEGFDGVVVKISDKTHSVVGNHITSAAGMTTVGLARVTIDEGLTGFEWGVGVPGSIGGAVRGNAGATGGEMKDIVESVEVYRNGEVSTIKKEDIAFQYRDTIFKHNSDVILRVTITLEKGENATGLKQAMEYLAYRNSTQPQGHASTGCIFKNHEVKDDRHDALKDLGVPEEFLKNKKIPAGWLVEKVGLKGKEIGGAKVSERHGNFIVNTGNARAEDVEKLIDEIKQKVYDTYSISLEEEIQRV